MKIDLLKLVEEHKKRVLSQLDNMFKAAEKVSEFKKIDFDFTNVNSINLEALDLTHVFYVFKIKDFGEKSNAQKLCKKIQSIKDSRKGLKLPKVNIENAIEGNTILYIGKSTGSFKTRLRQHLGLVSKKTYSLQLSHWLNEKGLTNIKIELLYTTVDFESIGIAELQEQKDILEILETSLHAFYKPLLGRTGH